MRPEIEVDNNEVITVSMNDRLYRSSRHSCRWMYYDDYGLTKYYDPLLTTDRQRGH